MSIDQSLFGDEPEPEPAAAPAPAVAAITDWQVDLLRKALDARALPDMAARQAAIEQAAGRSLASLRELTFDEANAVLVRLAEDAPRRDGTSLWDQREDDTWIDRL